MAEIGGFGNDTRGQAKEKLSNILSTMTRFTFKLPSWAKLWPIVASAFIVLCYWWHVHPPGFGSPGFYEDYCGSDLYRHIFAEQLKQDGKISFFTDRLMTPYGIPIGYSGVYLEREVVGILFWLLDRTLPYLWILFSVSLASIWFAGARTIQHIAQSQKAWTWFLAAWIAIFNIPRHEKTYYHHDQVFVHWPYLSLFLDIWIWDRVFKKREWDLRLELWRVFLAIAALTATSYSWGVMFFEWILFRGFILAQVKSLKIIKPTFKSACVPVVLSLTLLGTVATWLTLQIQSVAGLEKVGQYASNWAHWTAFFVPIGYDFVVALFNGTWATRTFTSAFTLETQITVGFGLWMLALGGFALSRQKKLAIPFLVFVLWVTFFVASGTIRHWTKLVIPSMSFFRVVSRMGLYLSPALVALFIVTLPDWKQFLQARSKAVRVIIVSILGVVLFTETLWLIRPIRAMQPFEDRVSQIMERARALPGDTVLDLPFCVAGGNGVCTTEQCKHYPVQYAGACFSTWHDKKVYGAYLGRMVPSQCDIYRRPPFINWFDAWTKERCFTPPEWDQFCEYLDKNQNISTVHVYPDMWLALKDPQCLSEFVKHLGPIQGEGVFEMDTLDLLPGMEYGRIWQFNSRCIKR